MTTDNQQQINIIASAVGRMIAGSLQPDLNLERARLLVECGKKEAEKMGINLVFAVVDGGGNLIIHERMDGSLLAAVEVARHKAFTALSMKLPTEDVGELVKEGAAFYGLGNCFNGKLVTFGGGRPVFFGDKLAGGLGVSGGSSEQDIAVAKACLNHLAEMEN